MITLSNFHILVSLPASGGGVKALTLAAQKDPGLLGERQRGGLAGCQAAPCTVCGELFFTHSLSFALPLSLLYVPLWLQRR